MPRRNIFDLISANWDLSTELDTITNLFNMHDMLVWDETTYSIEEVVDSYLLSKWSQRGTCISTLQMKYRLGIGPLVTFPFNDVADADQCNSILIRLEYISNMMHLIDITQIQDFDIFGAYGMLGENLKQLLEHIGYFQSVDKVSERVLIIPKDAAVMSVVEVANPTTVPYILQYNHFLLKGDIEQKSRILNLLGAELEPKRSDLAKRNIRLSEAVFFMLNNMNIRHNNKIPGKNYKANVANMERNEIEEWYDDTYQLILLAYLELDNADRLSKIDELKTKI